MQIFTVSADETIPNYFLIFFFSNSIESNANWQGEFKSHFEATILLLT